MINCLTYTFPFLKTSNKELNLNHSQGNVKDNSANWTDSKFATETYKGWRKCIATGNNYNNCVAKLILMFNKTGYETSVV